MKKLIAKYWNRTYGFMVGVITTAFMLVMTLCAWILCKDYTVKTK